MAATSRWDGVVNVVQRIGGPSVFRVTLGVVVHPACSRVDDDIFQHAAEADSVPDLRFAFARQADRLGVTAAFKVEHAVVGPAMLVVADELPLRVGGQRRFAGAAEAEEESGVAAWPDVGGAVHGKNAPLGQEVLRTENTDFLISPA